MKTLRNGLACTLFLLATAAGAQPAAERDFDHLRTGFALSGAHAAARCESCHVGGVFKGTPRDCEGCHVSGARFARNNVVKPGNHVPTVQACDSCHNTRTFTGARMNHGQVLRGSCTSCHSGVQATGKPAGHVRTSASCDSCHTSNGWRPANGFDHTGVAPGTCATCHNGSTATGRSASHPPYQLVAGLASTACDGCHKSGFRAWTPARLHSSVSVSTQCVSCHLAARPNNATHAGQTACEGCHRSTSTWGGARVDHATFTAATNCSSCHNGSAASGKSAAHIPTGATNCIGCHSTTAWRPARFTHGASVAGSTCKSCHNGSYASQGATAKPANHIPELQLLNGGAMDCSACHTTTTSWSQRMNHNNSLGGGAGWCKGCHASGTNYSGGLERKALTHERKTPPAIDCSESGCHRPLGNKGAAYSKWD